MALLLRTAWPHPHVRQAPLALQNANEALPDQHRGGQSSDTAVTPQKPKRHKHKRRASSRAALHKTTRGPAEQQHRQQRPQRQSSSAGRGTAHTNPTAPGSAAPSPSVCFPLRATRSVLP